MDWRHYQRRSKLIFWQAIILFTVCPINRAGATEDSVGVANQYKTRLHAMGQRWRPRRREFPKHYRKYDTLLEMVFASVPFALTTRPNHLSVWWELANTIFKASCRVRVEGKGSQRRPARQWLEDVKKWARRAELEGNVEGVKGLCDLEKACPEIVLPQRIE